MTQPSEAGNHGHDEGEGGIPRYGDWVTWAVVLLGTVIVLAATSELWMWHPWR